MIIEPQNGEHNGQWRSAPLPMIASVLHASPGTMRRHVSPSILNKQSAIVGNSETQQPVESVHRHALRGSLLMKFETSQLRPPVERSIVMPASHVMPPKPATRAATANVRAVADHIAFQAIDQKNYRIVESRAQITRPRLELSPSNPEELQVVPTVKRDWQRRQHIYSEISSPDSATSSGYWSPCDLSPSGERDTSLAPTGDNILPEENPYLLPVAVVAAKKPVSPVYDATDGDDSSEDEGVVLRRSRPLPQRPMSECPNEFAPPIPSSSNDRSTQYVEVYPLTHEERVADMFQFMKENNHVALSNLFNMSSEAEARKLIQKARNKGEVSRLYRVLNDVPVLTVATLGTILLQKDIRAYADCHKKYSKREFRSILNQLCKDDGYKGLHRDMLAKIKEMKLATPGNEKKQLSATPDDDKKKELSAMPGDDEKKQLSAMPGAVLNDHPVVYATRGNIVDVMKPEEDVWVMQDQTQKIEHPTIEIPKRKKRFSLFSFKRNKKPCVTVKRSVSDPERMRSTITVSAV
ncbi:MAG: uncharacterized protein KVP18_002654 [Porospora cf. gigantea A]|uniref:uncharacterized protein n=2 Tax=Porospora cf. gigantea A TaxID=2853593 RepID=UPI00355A2C6A|nr:MAG: hypothetical protein KVP18_002654 [Porospora cf. gigantea A]